jgi:hypothetical protein
MRVSPRPAKWLLVQGKAVQILRQQANRVGEEGYLLVPLSIILETLSATAAR